MMLIQDYGIQLWEDFLGFVVLFGVLGLLSVWPSVFKKYWVLGAMALNTWGSLTILPRALMRFDPVTFVYHTFWTVIGIWVMVTLWNSSWDAWMTRLDGWFARVVVQVSDIFSRKQGGEHERL